MTKERTSNEISEEKRRDTARQTSLERRLVSAARAIVTYQVGLPIGCMRVRGILWSLRSSKTGSYPVFDEYLVATRDLPVGTERLYWERDALRERDQRLEAANSKFRDRVFETCYDIIGQYAAATPPTPVPSEMRPASRAAEPPAQRVPSGSGPRRG